MSDLDLLKALQNELVNTLRRRKMTYEEGYYISQDVCRTKIRRLRLQLQEVMLRIERDCATDIGCKGYGETWFTEPKS